MAKTKKAAAPKGKQTPNTEKKTTKKVAPKKQVKKEEVVKVVEETIVIKTESPTLEGMISEPKEHIIENMSEIVVEDIFEAIPLSSNTVEIIDTNRMAYAIQTPLTEAELEEKALEAHYASLGQIEFYNKNIKK